MSKLLYIGGGVALGIGGLVVYHRYRHPLSPGYAALPTNAALPAGAALGRASLQVAPDHRVEVRRKDAERVIVALGQKLIKDNHLENIWGGQSVEVKRLESPPDAWVSADKAAQAPPFPLIAGVHAALVAGTKEGTSSAAKVAATAALNGWDVYVSLDENELIMQAPGCPDPTVKLGCALLIPGDPQKKPIPALPPAVAVAPAALPPANVPQIAPTALPPPQDDQASWKPSLAAPPVAKPGEVPPPAVAGYRTWRRWRDMHPGL